MGSIKMGIGLGLWHHGMPDAATLFEYIDKAEAWGIDSVWLSDHLMGPRPEVAIMPMMAAIAARTQRLKFGNLLKHQALWRSLWRCRLPLEMVLYRRNPL